MSGGVGITKKSTSWFVTSSFPGSEAARHGADIFVAHLLQTFGCERGPAAAAAMTNDCRVAIGKFVFDFKFNRSTTHVDRIRNVRVIKLVLVANIDNHRVGALCLCRGVGRRNFGDLLFRVRDQILETLVLSHAQNLTADYADETDNSNRISDIRVIRGSEILFVAERFDRIERSRFAGRIKSKEDSNRGAEHERDDDRAERDQ